MAFKIYTLTNMENIADALNAQYATTGITAPVLLLDSLYYKDSTYTNLTKVSLNAALSYGTVGYFRFYVQDTQTGLEQEFFYCLNPCVVTLVNGGVLNITSTNRWIEASRRYVYDPALGSTYQWVEENASTPRIALDEDALNKEMVVYDNTHDFWPTSTQIQCTYAVFNTEQSDLKTTLLSGCEEVDPIEFKSYVYRILDWTKINEYVQYLNNRIDEGYNYTDLRFDVSLFTKFQDELGGEGYRLNGGWNVSFHGDSKIVVVEFRWVGPYTGEEYTEQDRYRMFVAEGSYYDHENSMQKDITSDMIGKVEKYNSGTWITSTLEHTKMLFSPLACDYPYCDESGTVRGAEVHFSTNKTIAVDDVEYSVDYISSVPSYNTMSEKENYDEITKAFYEMLSITEEPDTPTGNYTTSDLLNDIAKIIQEAEGDTSKKIRGKDLAVRLKGVIGSGGNTPSSTNTLKKLLDFTKSADRMFAARMTEGPIGEDSYLIDANEYLQYSDTENVISMIEMFSGCERLTNVNINTNSLQYASGMFSRCRSLIQAPEINGYLHESASMFTDCESLEKIETLNISQVNVIQSIFARCYNLTSIPKLDTSNVHDWGYAFDSCYKLKTIDVSRFYCNSDWNSYSMCARCYSLTSFIIREFGDMYVLSSDAFDSCYHLNGILDPTYNPDGLKDGYIYVPDHMVSTLQNETNWSRYASQIKPLSSLEE